jgi:hypothetical protein
MEQIFAVAPGLEAFVLGAELYASVPPGQAHCDST